MQYKVPQHVDIEDKVIGSLTIRQFVIVLVGMGIIGLFKVLLVGPLANLFWPIAIVIGFLFGAVAFAKYGDINLEVFLLSAVKTFTSPRKRVWQKEPYKVQNEKEKIQKPEEPKKPEDKRVSITQAHDNLEKLAEVVDSGGYAAIAGSSAERNMNFGQHATETLDAPDIIGQAEATSPEVDAMLEEASKVAPKHEELVSEVASVLPDQAQKETPTIKLRKDQFYKEIR